MYKSKAPYSTVAKNEKTFNLQSAKRNTPGFSSGPSILASIPSANKNMQLQGFTIKPDTKYTSLAEVHQRGIRSNFKNFS